MFIPNEIRNVWETPYTVKSKRFYLFFYKHEVLFEGDSVFRIIGGLSHIDEARRICSALTGAYNLGMQHAFNEIEYRC